MLTNRKILLVEDDDDLRMIFGNKFRELNCSIVLAHSGNKAIKLFENGLNVDFIISDYSMPDGDGLTLLNYVLKSNLSLPFVFFTNTLNPNIPIQYEHFLGTIPKFNFDQLIHVVKTKNTN